MGPVDEWLIITATKAPSTIVVPMSTAILCHTAPGTACFGTGQT